MSILRSGFSVAIGTLFSRIFGLFRELLVAGAFGTTIYGDALNTAFKLPNLFRRILGEGALSVVFIPIFSTLSKKDKIESERFSSEVFTMLVILSILIIVIFEIFMPELMYIFAPGFSVQPEKFIFTVFLCRITMPYLLLIILSSLVGGMLNSVRRFAAYAFAPVIVNTAMIIGTVISHDKAHQASSICFALMVGGILQLIFLHYISYISGIKFSIVNILNLSSNTISFLKSMPQAASTQGIAQLNIFISQSIASFVPGAVSILAYADRLYQLPLSLIGICFGTILLPELSKLYDSKKNNEATELQTNAIKIALIISIPAAVGIIALSYPITHILYERGAFTSNDTYQTSITIIAFTTGLPAYILSKILSPIFYSKLDVKTPFKISLYTIVVNIILNIFLMIWLKHVGIAIGTSIAAWFNLFLLIIFTKNISINILNENISIFVIKLMLANIFMGIFVYYISSLFSSIIYGEIIINKILALLFIIVIGILIYFLLVILFRLIKINFSQKSITW